MNYEDITVDKLLHDHDLQEVVLNALWEYTHLMCDETSVMCDETSDFVDRLSELVELSGFTFAHEKFQYYAWVEILSTLIKLRRQYKIVTKEVTQVVRQEKVLEKR